MSIYANFSLYQFVYLSFKLFELRQYSLRNKFCFYKTDIFSNLHIAYTFLKRLIPINGFYVALAQIFNINKDVI